MFAARAAGGSASHEIAARIERHCADGAMFVAEMVLGGVRILAAALPCRALDVRDEVFEIAERESLLGGELFRARGDEHHVFAFLENAAGEANRIADALDGSDGACLQCGTVHHDCVELNAAVEREVRADACVEHGIVFERDDCGPDSIHGRATAREDLPCSFERGADSGATVSKCGLRNLPCAAVNDKGGSQGWRGSEVRIEHQGNAERNQNRPKEKRETHSEQESNRAMPLFNSFFGVEDVHS